MATAADGAYEERYRYPEDGTVDSGDPSGSDVRWLFTREFLDAASLQD